MRRRAVLSAVLFMLASASSTAPAQTDGIVARESFDTVAPPSLPPGWVSSRLRQPPADDFAVSASSPHSPPQALLAVNATLAQWLLSPPWQWTGQARLEFWIRRSATFGAPLLVEATFDDGATFPLTLGDTLRPTGSASFSRITLLIPDSVAGAAGPVRFRWRFLPEDQGAAGTFRLDDLLLATTDSAAEAPPAAFPRGTLVINEIMAAPAPGEPEWVEILNTRPETLLLSGWQISDAALTSRHLIPDVTLPPGGLAVLTHDSAALAEARGPIPAPLIQVPGFPSLNNDADMIVLYDPAGTVIDSVAYDASWHNPAVVSPAGRSLERLRPEMPSNDPRNWTSSASRTGATPGAPNSVFARKIPEASTLSCAPNPFSPNAEGVGANLPDPPDLPKTSGNAVSGPSGYLGMPRRPHPEEAAGAEAHGQSACQTARRRYEHRVQMGVPQGVSPPKGVPEDRGIPGL